MATIQKLLIANRGEIARRIMRTCRAMGISSVAVYAEPDETAPFVREADEAVALPGRTAAETYLNVVALLDAARRAGADAVHPGYGFLSENAGFARAVIAAGLTWIGPHPDAIEAMGDKLRAKRLMADAGVPVLAGFEVNGSHGLAGGVRDLGLPVLVKAAGGGGGRGMRVVTDEAQLEQEILSASREAENAFGNGTVFVERYLERARHIEVQILGDRHGNLVHLFERECSVQRRHQKVIEEAPSPAVDEVLRRKLSEAALAAGRAIGYDNAGTVEFLVAENGEFHFLEVNTRLQVEHPVTEAITGVDLVREQILVAQGAPLTLRQEDLRIKGHAIEVRLYAEDPAHEFMPLAGTVLAWEPDSAIPVRWDSGVETGSEVPVYFDPMLAKAIAHAPDRAEAALRLALGLERLRVHGLATNRDFLVNTLRHPAFLSGDTTTDFIERVSPARSREVQPAEVGEAAIAASLEAQARRRAEAPVLRTLPSGWRNNPSQPQRMAYRHVDAEVVVQYERARDGSFAYTVGERSGRARLLSAENGRVLLDVDGVQRTFIVTRRDDQVFVQTPKGEVVLSETPRFPVPEIEGVAGGYQAPLPGKVVQIFVEQGASVSRGDLLLTIEAMKMEHRISAASDGLVKELLVEVGQQVDGGQVLLVLEDPAAGDGGEGSPS
ncbi:MAG TPA: biotin carboxylase N-terminal domain-containing protein [Tepidiformaceae bacterium]